MKKASPFRSQSFVVPDISSKDDMTNDTESKNVIDRKLSNGATGSIYCNSFITTGPENI